MVLIKEIIIEKEEQLLKAMVSSDFKTLKNLLNDDLIFINHEGIVLTKDDDLKVHQSGDLKIAKLKAFDQQISIHQDTAVVSVRVTLEGLYSGQPFSGNFRYGRVWKVVNTKLQVISAHASLIK
jgi:hypothetical protein